MVGEFGEWMVNTCSNKGLNLHQFFPLVLPSLSTLNHERYLTVLQSFKHYFSFNFPPDMTAEGTRSLWQISSGIIFNTLFIAKSMNTHPHTKPRKPSREYIIKKKAQHIAKICHILSLLQRNSPLIFRENTLSHFWIECYGMAKSSTDLMQVLLLLLLVL